MALQKWISIVFISILSLTVINACSTVSGVGKDIQKAGQVIEKEAEKNKK